MRTLKPTSFPQRASKPVGGGWSLRRTIGGDSRAGRFRLLKIGTIRAMHAEVSLRSNAAGLAVLALVASLAHP